jgi:hypothetical protein
MQTAIAIWEFELALRPLDTPVGNVRKDGEPPFLS